MKKLPIRIYRKIFPETKYGNIASKYYPKRIKQLNELYLKTGFVPKGVCTSIFFELIVRNGVKKPITKDNYEWEYGLVADVDGNALAILFPKITYDATTGNRRLDRDIAIFSQSGIDTKTAKQMIDLLLRDFKTEKSKHLANYFKENNTRIDVPPDYDKVVCCICEKSGQINKDSNEWFINKQYDAHCTCAEYLIKRFS